MPRGGARPGAGRPRKSPEAKAATTKKPRVAAMSAKKGFTAPDGQKAEDAPKNWPFGTKPPEEEKKVDQETDDGLTDEQRAGLTPLEYLLAVMRSPDASKSARMQAAIQAAPYMHARPAPMGKKESKQKDAEKTAGRFSAGAPPKLVAAGGKRV